MTLDINIHRAYADQAHYIAIMAGELLHEIMAVTGLQSFNFNLEETTARLQNAIEHEKYFVFIAESKNTGLVGFISMYESYALYAEGSFGTIPELFVRPAFRSQDIGKCLIEQAKAFGYSKGWRRLEVTTPPLPQFNNTLAFYEREHFTITGGRKLKVSLTS